MTSMVIGHSSPPRMPTLSESTYAQGEFHPENINSSNGIPTHKLQTIECPFYLHTFNFHAAFATVLLTMYCCKAAACPFIRSCALGRACSVSRFGCGLSCVFVWFVMRTTQSLQTAQLLCRPHVYSGLRCLLEISTKLLPPPPSHGLNSDPTGSSE